MYGCQQILISFDYEKRAILEFICSESNKLFNGAIYYARQIWFKARRYITKFELDDQMKSNRHFQAMYSQAAQQTCRSVFEAFKSFRELNAAYKRGEIFGKPSPPRYRKHGLNLVSYPKQALKLKDGKIRVPLGTQVKVWFGIDSFTLPMPSNLNFADIKELRILPRNRCFYAEFVYKNEVVKTISDKNRILGIDHGVNNWLTCVNNIGTSFIVDGHHVKSLNCWYNKFLSTQKVSQPQGFWSNKLTTITEKRNRQIRDAINKAARIVINHCLEHQIGIVVFGWGEEIKKQVDLNKKRNQEFVPIPTDRLKRRIEQLCQLHGIEFIETEEASTSAASFLDGDSLPKHGEKPVGWKSSGCRVKRGLFRTAANWYINADCNGAANILRKVSTTLGFDLSGVSRGVLTRPQRIKLWSAKKKRSAVA